MVGDAPAGMCYWGSAIGNLEFSISVARSGVGAALSSEPWSWSKERTEAGFPGGQWVLVPANNQRHHEVAPISAGAQLTSTPSISSSTLSLCVVSPCFRDSMDQSEAVGSAPRICGYAVSCQPRHNGNKHIHAQRGDIAG